MKTYFDCIPCFIRQTIDAVRLVTDDQKVHEQVLRRVLALTGEMDLNATPPAMAQKIHRIIKESVSMNDPYKQAKHRFNEFALKLFGRFQGIVSRSDKPFETAVRLAIAGNIIDLGVKCSLELSEAEEVIEDALTQDFNSARLDEFQKAVTNAEDILYLADNAGEIVFDRFLIEQIGPDKVTVAVKGAPVINDATIDDARAAGLTDLVKVIDNGDDAPGTILESSSSQFRQRFDEADVVIAKGQGNYETLSDIDKNIFFILKAKCPVVAGHLNCPIGTLILHRNNKPKGGNNYAER